MDVTSDLGVSITDTVGPGRLKYYFVDVCFSAILQKKMLNDLIIAV